MEVNKNNFNKEVMESKIPVLVDFYANWCGPCMMLSPILEEIAEEKKDSLKVVKVNVDNEIELANQFSINSIPAVFLIIDGKVVSNFLGYRSKSDVIKFLENKI